MKILELFCGTKSFSNVAKERGHEVFTIDNNPKFKPDLCINVLELKKEDIPFDPDIIWASPPCESFSVAAISKNWNKGSLIPKTVKGQLGIDLVSKTIEIIVSFTPKYYFIENPRGMLRKMPFMNNKNLKTITYCQYGDNKMKPTDIWTNCANWNPKKMCKNGMSCHISAPRGSRTGVQGLKNNIERGIIPKELCLEIIKVCEKC